MKPNALFVVILICLTVIIGLVLSGSSRYTFLPSRSDIVIENNNPTVIIIQFSGWLDGLKKLNILLPPRLKRNPVDAFLTDETSGEVFKLETDHRTRHRSRRMFYLEKPLPYSHGKPLALHLAFKDDLIAKPGTDDKSTFDGLAISAYYKLDLAEALKNFRRFKPVACAILFLLIVFVSYAATSIFLLRGVFTGYSGSDSQ